MQKRENSSRPYFAKRNAPMASQTQCNIGACAMCRFAESVGYGPRCAVPYSTGRSDSVLQRQLPSLVFWKANDFSMVRR
jgi:hypothetical protein